MMSIGYSNGAHGAQNVIAMLRPATKREVGAARGSGPNIHVYPSNLRHESRIMKITNSLIEGGVFSEIEVLGKWERGLPHVERLDNGVVLRRVAPRFQGLDGSVGRILRVTTWYAAALRYLLSRRFAVINAHSLAVLPLCAFVHKVRGGRLIYDTHELETEVIKSRGLTRPFLKLVERALIRRADAVSVVNTEIAEWYTDAYAIAPPFVVQNAPERQQPNVHVAGIRQRLHIPSDAIVFIYQGLFSEGRGLRSLIEVFGRQPAHKHVIFLGYGPLASEIKNASQQYANIHHHEAVPIEALPSLTREADVGLSVIEKACLSYYLCLPNKLFEYISAGIPVIGSNFPVMSRVIRELGCGWVVNPDFQSMQQLISSITRGEIEEKRTAAALNSSRASWSNEVPELMRMYSSIGLSGQSNEACMDTQPLR